MWVAARTNARSGDFALSNGVGTQMKMTSASASAAADAVASNRSALTIAATRSAATSSMWLSPRFSAAARSASTSNPSERKPDSAYEIASGSPT